MEETERTTEPTSVPPWFRRRKALIAAVAVAVAGLSFLAGTGWDPGSLLGGGDAGPIGDWSTAETVAVDDGDGVSASVQVARTIADVDGRCVRVLLAGEVMASRCADGPLEPWHDPDFEIVRLEDYFGSFAEHAVRADGRWVVALSGAVHPDVVRVTAHFGDGSEYSFVTRNAGGWFVTVLPDDVADPAVDDGRLVNAPVRLELFDAEATRVASVDLASLHASGGAT